MLRSQENFKVKVDGPNMGTRGRFQEDQVGTFPKFVWCEGYRLIATESKKA